MAQGRRPSAELRRRSRPVPATNALDTVLLVGRDLARQGQSAVEGQVRDGGEVHLFGVLMSKIESADDPAFVADIVDSCDLAPGRVPDDCSCKTASMGALTVAESGKAA